MEKVVYPELQVAGRKLVEIRKRLGITQAHFSLVLNISDATLRSIEKGEDHRMDSLIQATRSLKLDAFDLLNPNSSTPNVPIDFIIKLIKEVKKVDPRFNSITIEAPSAVTFIREILPKTDFISEKHNLKEIIEYIKLEYDVKLEDATLRAAITEAVTDKLYMSEGKGKGIKYFMG